MKCSKCGGEISLEDKVCPFCGNVNKDAVEHIRAMEEYKKRYKVTEEEVTRKTKRFASVAVKAVILALLLVGIGIMMFIYSRAYSFPEKARRREALRHPDKCRAKMTEYLENGDYSGFSSYIAYNSIPVYEDKFEDFKDLKFCADYYLDTIGSIEKIVMHGDDEKWLKWDASNDAGRCSRFIGEFYETVENRREREENESNLKYYDDMKADVDAALSVYLGMDEKTLEEFIAMTENKRSAYLEEVILGE